MTALTLKNQRVVIIGGSSGIGLATARQALEQGASVVIAGRSEAKLAAARQLLSSDKVETYALDNRDNSQLELFFKAIGSFDHLFTPGASYVRGPITSDEATAESCFKAKFWPQYYAVKFALPYLHPAGSIVLMSGAFSQRPLTDGASYAACNGAIESLGKALAVELAPKKIRANVISPGTIYTAFNWEGAEQATRDASYNAYTDMNVLGRVGKAAEAAHTVVYLMTNSYTTGTTLHPDGGYLLR